MWIFHFLSAIMNDTMDKIEKKRFNNMKKCIHDLTGYLKGHREIVLQCFLALWIFVLGTYRLSEIGQPILFNDEVGYWSNSAFFMGIDWTSVTGRIGYYSYGYSLLLIPIRILGNFFGWSWETLYHAAVIMNVLFLIMSYILAMKLAERYMPRMNCWIRSFACFAIFTYSSNIVYAHITWTECTLLFFFWVFLYVMMRVTDEPCMGNHIAFAMVSFYLYTVHQRALGVVVAATLIVLLMRFFRHNRIQDVAVFLGSMYLYSLVHAMVKGNLQHVNYLGGEPLGLSDILGFAFTKKSLVFLAVGICLLLLQWLLDKGHRKAAIGLLTAGIALGAGYFMIRGGQSTNASDIAVSAAESRISTNDFSGQWGVLKNIFSVNGLIRLGISAVGKWFYMAAASGLVVCWGIWGLFKNAWAFLKDGISRLETLYGKGGCSDRGATPESIGGLGDDGDSQSNGSSDKREAYEVGTARKEETLGNDAVVKETTAFGDSENRVDLWKERIWFLGVLLAWLGTFMISAIYKEGLYKNDDLFNGRYVEFTVGFLLLFGFYCLLNDKKWVRTAALYMVLYIAAGYMCQYTLDILQRKTFELAHCVMFGRIFWNWSVPVGKVAELSKYVLSLGGAFLLILKPLSGRFDRIKTARTVLALMIPVLAWSYLGRTIVDVYVVARNEKQAEPFIGFAGWIGTLRVREEEKVYYVVDSADERAAGALQHILQEQPVTMTSLTEVDFTEDAFFIVRQDYQDMEEIADNCVVVRQAAGYILLINKNQQIMKRWEAFIQP